MDNLNNQVSGILKAFSEMSNEKHRLWEIEEKNKQIHKLKNVCGSCFFWMTKKCRFESPRNKVTCNDRICSDFQMQKWTGKLIIQLENEVVELKNRKWKNQN